jgi:hypothetical protein
MPSCYYVKALHTTTYLLNHLPCKPISASCPYVTLYGVTPSYEHLRVFSCVCYPNLSAQLTHKLASRSTHCVFLGYSADHKGYQCLNTSSTNIVISRHVVFDEAVFPFAASPRLTNDLDIFMQETLSVWLLCPHHYRRPGFPQGSHRCPLIAVRPRSRAVRPPREQRLEVRLPPGTKAGNQTITPGGQTAWPLIAPSVVASQTSIVPRKAPMTPPVPHAALTSKTPPVALAHTIHVTLELCGSHRHNL